MTAEQILSLTDFLDAQGLEYEVGHHVRAYTAQEIAGAQHIPGKHLAKTVIAKAGDRFIMCVLPAIRLLDFAKLERVVGTHELTLATEQEISRLFPNCEVGAEPPFGTWEGQELTVYMDSALQGLDFIVFNAGTHTETVRMKLGDYERLVNPQIADIGIPI
jgi:Ala-tRNA(Pro) deacylase